ncbi:MAG: CDP-diacylglycerol--serine O-phosphatidyltransferase [Alphaproteobacteria bacterium]|nr:CDP-diacylglycerol--serine O-phosphatidyltransferase [Alphaproteobacteria bacterium]
MNRPRRRPRIKTLPFNRLLPNIVTVLALCAGLTAIRFGFQARWELAVLAIVLAGIFDALDGRLARLVGGSTKFGAELDSLSDFVSFGVAPAVLLYFWTLQHARGVGWALALLFAVCAALRLARFNTKLGVSDMPAWAYNYFTGVPAPGAAGLVLLPMILSFQFPGAFLVSPVLNAAVIVTVAFLMISRIPTYSFKQFGVPHKLVLPVLLLVGLMAAFLVTSPWATVTVIGIAYIVSLPFSVRSFRALQREAARLRERVPEEAMAEVEAAEAAADRVFEEVAEHHVEEPADPPPAAGPPDKFDRG